MNRPLPNVFMKRKLFIWLLLPALLGCRDAGSQDREKRNDSGTQMTAPEFPEGLQWLNTDRPLWLRDLRGKVVLLDFWTYCCINCMHIIPDLKRLESEYPDELVVIGIHSAKFTEEKETDNIRQAILRYEIRHPVINDRDFTVWNLYGARAWPTVVLLDTRGRLAGVLSGEGVYARFAGTIAELVKDAGKQGLLDRTPLNLKLEAAATADNFLAYPGKLLADSAGGRLFISDQNHNRVLVCDLDDGSLLETIGSGELGFRDGEFAAAQFNHPQGLALVGDTLYLADTENHSVRALDLKGRQVTTIAGDGTQAPGFGAPPGRGLEVKLSSPWDLAYQEGILFVAMAGTHQIWSIRLRDGWCEPFAGTAREGLRDGERRQAWLAQPSGLALGGGRLYFADSEVSAARYVDLQSGEVGTLVGEALFEFGDRDGRGKQARLQHPLGVAWDGNKLYVADTYNSKIKVIDPQTGETRSVVGDGESGNRDGKGLKARLYEPGGLGYAGGKLYISDTNNHLIRIYDAKTDEVTTMNVRPAAAIKPAYEQLTSRKMVSPGHGEIKLALNLPQGFKLSPGSAVALALVRADSMVRTSNGSSLSIPVDGATGFALPVDWIMGSGSLDLDVDYIYCSQNDEAVCRRGYTRLNVPVDVRESAGAGVVVVAVSPPEPSE